MIVDTLVNDLIAPVKRSLSDEIVQSLRDAIISGAFSQGERLREDNFARTLKVSRGPIREAQSKLEREGLVVISLAITHTATAVRKAADLDVRFHESLVQAAYHTRLYRHWMELRPQIEWLLLTRTINADFNDYAVIGHQKILDAIRSKSKTKAMDNLAHHMSVTYDRVADVYIKQL
jgi:DNA-binding GntR family transcriptional regulator